MKSIKKFFVIVLLLAWGSISAGAVDAAFLKFDKASYSVAVDETFDVEIIVNPGSEQITSVDAYVIYDSAIINADSVTEGSYFPTVLNDLTTGKVYIAGLVDSPSDYKEGVGTVATVTFKALKEGETDLVFDCDGQATVTSKVIKNDINSTDIIVCSENGTATVTIGVGGTTPDATGGAEDTPTPTPTQAVVTQLPASGTTENMIAMSILGAILVGVGGLTKLIKF